MRIGEVLRCWRSDECMGIREAAKMIAISPATLSHIERGKNVDGTRLVKLMFWLFGPQAKEMDDNG